MIVLNGKKYVSICKFNEKFIETYDRDSDKGYILEADVKIYMICIMIYHFYQKEWNLINAISLSVICMIKNYVVHIRSLKQALKHGLILKKYIE